MMQTHSLETLLTPSQVADALGVNLTTLEAWRSTRRYPLQFVKVGRLVRYRAADVAAFLEARTHGAGGAL